MSDQLSGKTGQSDYANLPDDLISKMLDGIPKTVARMNSLFDIHDKPIQDGYEKLRTSGLIATLTATSCLSSVIAADGSWILERMTGSDILLAIAIGVEGLTEDVNAKWGPDNHQLYQWQTVLPHSEDNARLGQGIMFLMELSVLANASHDLRIMDGAHFTSILKINSMLSATLENSEKEYSSAIREFLEETYAKIIPDIPDILNASLSNDKILALAKYSSSRDAIDKFLPNSNINLDDKTFFTLALKENEYFKPLPVGQSDKERKKIWNDLHIKCNLDIKEKDQLNKRFKQILSSVTTKGHSSSLYFTYYKPHADGPAYRIEIKKTLAIDQERLECYLNTLKSQIVFPLLREPYPQYLADIMAKGISSGMFAIKEAIRLSPQIQIDNGRFNLLFNYRT